MSFAAELASASSRLRIPTKFLKEAYETDAGTPEELEIWKRSALEGLYRLIEALRGRNDSLSDEDFATIVDLASRLDSEGRWSTPEIRKSSQEILASLPPATPHLIKYVFLNRVKPLFSTTTPHPKINLTTGRKLPREAGGPHATMDFYDDQDWKQPGVWSLILWCVQKISTKDWEDLWPLVIPPMMTLLDDFQARYKIAGLDVVSAMLASVPPYLLKRTGVDNLLFASLNTTMTHLNDPLTAPLLRKVIPTFLALIDVTTSPSSKERYEKLFGLLGNNIIGSVWVYSTRDLAAIEASIDVLPQVIEASGLPSVRFLKALIPQLTHALTLDLAVPSTVSLQLSSLRSLLVVTRVCAPRIAGWRGHILEGVGTCWVHLSDAERSGKPAQAADDLKSLLKQVIKSLEEAYPSVREVEFASLLELDRTMFANLIEA